MRRYFAQWFVFAVLGLALAPATRAALVEYLPLHGNTIATVGTDGIPVNSPTPTTDQNGTPNSALAFSSIVQNTDGNYVSIAGGGGLDGLQTGTMAFWVKWTGIQEKSCCGEFFGVVTARQSNGIFSDDVIGLDNADPSLAHIDVRLDTCCGSTVTGSTVVDSGWHFVALTFTPGFQELYLDGNLDGTGFSGANTHIDGSVPLTLGAWSGDGHTYSNSAMHDFRAYDEVLTQQQIRGLMIPEPSIAFSMALAGASLAGHRRRRV
jgi:hypothetical protein